MIELQNITTTSGSKTQLLVETYPTGLLLDGLVLFFELHRRINSKLAILWFVPLLHSVSEMYGKHIPLKSMYILFAKGDWIFLKRGTIQ